MEARFFGLILLGLITVLSVISVYVYSRYLTKCRQKEYDNAYATLKFLLEYGIVDRPGYRYIKSKFAEIAKMRGCNYEKCQVLEQEFYKKYHEIIIKEHESILRKK